jgi:dihydropteroate synthase
MKNSRIVIIDSLDEAYEEINKIGCDIEGTKIMAPKAVHRVVKINDVSIPAAQILKEEMLSAGGEAARARGAVNFSIDKTDVLLMGNLKQYKRLVKKLSVQPFKLKQLSEEISRLLKNYDLEKKPMVWGKGNLLFGEKTLVMGIINITPDSFSGDGLLGNLESVNRQVESFIENGVDIIDVGGESTRPGSLAIEPDEEISRVVPVIKAITQRTDIPVSIDSYKPEVVKAALDAGASIINDITALENSEMRKLAAKYGVPVIIMHMKGTPKDMQENPNYENVIDEIIYFLADRISLAEQDGISREFIIIDPGIGFGKTLEHNLEILKRLSEFKSLGCPILVGTSRKSFIGKILDADIDERIFGTAASVALAIANGADIVRVHDIEQMTDVVKVCDAVAKGGNDG